MRYILFILLLLPTNLYAQSLEEAGIAWSRQQDAEHTVAQLRAAEINYDISTKIGLTAGGILSAMDLGRTMYELGAKTAYEQNPFLAPLSEQPELFAAVKLSIDAAVAGYILYVKDKHPRLAMAVTYLWVGAKAVVVYLNYKTSLIIRSRQ
jgi:hypothetical protein